MTHSETLSYFGAGFAKVPATVYHYWRFNRKPPDIIWEEQATAPHDADGFVTALVASAAEQVGREGIDLK